MLMIIKEHMASYYWPIKNPCYNPSRQSRQQACNEKKTPLAEGAFFVFINSLWDGSPSGYWLTTLLLFSVEPFADEVANHTCNNRN